MALPVQDATERSRDYEHNRARGTGADLVLRHTLLELARHVGPEQARALCYAAGKRIAAAHPLGRLERLSDLERAASAFLAERDWGWVSIEERQESVDLIHGCSPLRAWFGEPAQVWAGGLFEGCYTEWLRQLGAGEGLELRQVDEAGNGDVLRYRLMHQSRFAS
jgi:predicted hydrocarbon binding protein